MKNEVKEKVIKPPMKRITSGKIFKPSKSYLHKILLQPIIAVLIISLAVIVIFIGAAYLGAVVEPESVPNAPQFINTWIFTIIFWTIVINLIWLIPVLVYIPFSYRVIEYSVKAETGETMPEVYVKRGVVTVTRKHVPFRTITNISSKAGPFDRFFGIECFDNNISLNFRG